MSKDDKKMPQKTKSNRNRIPPKLITIKTEFLEHTINEILTKKLLF